MQSLSVRYRPQTLEEVCGQKSIVKILQKQVQLNKIKNCLLLCGPSGTGKTTIARAFAKLVNDNIGEPIEIDAASNSGVDNVRSIIAQANERAIDAKYKIFIIDEAHMLSSAAWAAFLKGIEEPPAYTIYIFCTTDPQKVPATIQNRVMRFNLTKLDTDTIINRLEYVCRAEQLSYTTDALEFIAKLSNGGMRDALANLEKVVAYGDVSIENTLECLGAFSYKLCFNLVNAIIDGDETTILNILNSLYMDGYDLKYFVEHFVNFVLDLSKFTIFGNMDLIKIPKSMEKDVQYVVGIENAKKYFLYLVDKLFDLKLILKDDTNIKDTVEIWFLKMVRGI